MRSDYLTRRDQERTQQRFEKDIERATTRNDVRIVAEGGRATVSVRVLQRCLIAGRTAQPGEVVRVTQFDYLSLRDSGRVVRA